MKWISHQTAALGFALLLHFPPVGIGVAWVGAVLPDMLDQKMSCLGRNANARQRIFNRIHRGTTHWFGWWLGLFVIAFIPKLPAICHDVLLGLGFGGLSHVILDMLTPRGIPFLPFSQKHRVALPICVTGSWSEYCFLAVMLVSFGWLLHNDIWRLF